MDRQSMLPDGENTVVVGRLSPAPHPASRVVHFEVCHDEHLEAFVDQDAVDDRGDQGDIGGEGGSEKK